MTNGLLLWADDEMELLKPHLLFLEKKGYEVVTVTNGMALMLLRSASNVPSTWYCSTR